jgi:hypothetical protein
LGTNVTTKIALKLKIIYNPCMRKKQTTTVPSEENTDPSIPVQVIF